MANKLYVSAAPHITGADSTQKIMGRVCLALLPTLFASVIHSSCDEKHMEAAGSREPSGHPAPCCCCC